MKTVVLVLITLAVSISGVLWVLNVAQYHIKSSKKSSKSHEIDNHDMLSVGYAIICVFWMTVFLIVSWVV